MERWQEERVMGMRLVLRNYPPAASGDRQATQRLFPVLCLLRVCMHIHVHRNTSIRTHTHTHTHTMVASHAYSSFFLFLSLALSNEHSDLGEFEDEERVTRRRGDERDREGNVRGEKRGGWKEERKGRMKGG